jgi:hypothetical protein
VVRPTASFRPRSVTRRSRRSGIPALGQSRGRTYANTPKVRAMIPRTKSTACASNAPPLDADAIAIPRNRLPNPTSPLA